MRIPFTALILCTTIVACTQFPELDAQVSDSVRNAPFPDMVPLNTLDTQIGPGRVAPDAAGQMEARVAQLKSRAAQLRRTVIDRDTRERMQSGVQS